jgi:hypothetical protein
VIDATEGGAVILPDKAGIPSGDSGLFLSNGEIFVYRIESALGRSGPRSRPANYRSPCQIPKGWNYGHLNYLQTDPAAPAPIPPPTDVPEDGPLPLGGAPGWHEAWSAAFASTRFQ